MDSRIVAWLLGCACAAILVPAASFAGNSPQSGEYRPVLLSHLPIKTSRAYRALHNAAGNPNGEILPITKSEMWSIAPDKLEALRTLGAKHGVTVTEITDPAMNALVPMAQGKPMTAKQIDMMKSAKADKSTMGVAMMGLPEPTVLEHLLTRGMNTPGSTNATITLKLSDMVTVNARRTDIVSNGDNYVWHGEIEGTAEPVTLVVWPQGRIAGTIQHKGKIYKVQSMGGGMHGIIESAPAMLPPEHAPISGALQKKMNMNEDPLSQKGDASHLMKKMQDATEPLENLRDAPPAPNPGSARPSLGIDAAPKAKEHAASGPITITLIVAYTKAAASHYADIGKDLITLAVAETNQSFRNSGISNLTVKVVHTYQSDYMEKGTHFEHMYQFAEPGDGQADEIHALRKKYRANVAILIVDDANGCGLSAGVAPPASRAFAVVHHGCAAATYSLAHEIGHIIGARHDTALDSGTTPFAYGHGFVNGMKWRTMMSYEQSCGGCPRLPIWSSPDIRVKGEAAGDETANNARVIREGAKRVSAFR